MILASTSTKILVVNTSSLLAVMMVPRCALYCASRAARDALIATMTLEHPEHRFLNWSPGPMDTDQTLK